jgi:hypothetical protein
MDCKVVSSTGTTVRRRKAGRTRNIMLQFLVRATGCPER